MAIFNELDSVTAIRDLNTNVKSGTPGVIHQVYEVGDDVYYLVEFIIDDERSVIDVIAVNEKDIKLKKHWKPA